MAARREAEHPVRGDHRAPLASTFLRGLTLGAFVGAAVAGSVLLGRRRANRDKGADASGAKRVARGG